MKISSIIDITGGKLLNTPSISFINGIKTCAKDVRHGDLFIAKNIQDITFCIENGAFLILVDYDVCVSDHEIAWIKVDNLDEALIKLLRFQLAVRNLDTFYTNFVTFNYLKALKGFEQVNLKLVDNIENLVKILKSLKNGDKLVFSNKLLSNKLSPKNKELKLDNVSLTNVVQHTIFETSFVYNNVYFPKIKVPKLYLKEFIIAYKFMQDDNLDLQKLKNFHFLKPIFVNKFLNETQFGRSSKMLIFQDRIELAKKEIKYLEENFKYGNVIYISCEYIKNLFIKQNIIKNLDKIKEFLKLNDFNMAYFIGFNYETLDEILNIKDDPFIWEF